MELGSVALDKLIIVILLLQVLPLNPSIFLMVDWVGLLLH